MPSMTDPCARYMAWIKHCVRKLTHSAVPARPDRRFPVCRIGGVTAREYPSALWQAPYTMSLYYVKVSLNLRADAALAPIYAHCGNAARCLLTSFLGVFLRTLLDAVRRGGIVQVINKYFYVLSIYCLNILSR